MIVQAGLYRTWVGNPEDIIHSRDVALFCSWLSFGSVLATVLLVEGPWLDPELFQTFEFRSPYDRIGGT